MKDISTIRRTVATIANQLHKLGYTLRICHEITFHFDLSKSTHASKLKVIS